MRRAVLGVTTMLAVLLAAGAPAVADSEADLAKRLRRSTEVLKEMAGGSRPEIPRELLAHARGIAVFPGVTKGALIVGGRHGEGVMCVRRPGGWSPPAFFTIGGGSFGLQVGGQVVDLVLVIMSDKGVDRLLRSETTLGGDASLAAGPKSLHQGAATDGTFKAEIYSYARSSGFFAGASFEGATVQPDGGAIRTLYGARADSREVLLGGKLPVPASARSFVGTLASLVPPPRR
jgi:lipid-binding SYLF domain-containing protein